MSWFGQWFSISGGGGGGGGSAVILSVTPGSFDGLTPDEARWTPIVVLVQIRSGDNLGINYYEDTTAFPRVVYDADRGVSPLWGGKTTIVQQSNPLQFLCTLLPNGGWNTSNFEIKLLSQVEATQ